MCYCISYNFFRTNSTTHLNHTHCTPTIINDVDYVTLQSFPMEEVCSHYFHRIHSDFKNDEETYRLSKIFNRFKNVNDFHEKDDRNNTSNRSPLIFAAEKDCFRVAVVGVEQCENEYRYLDLLFRDSVNTHNAEKNESEPNWSYISQGMRNQFVYLNSGGAIGRVWAFKEFLQSLDIFESFRLPPTQLGFWNCDQSVISSIYVELFFWELKQRQQKLPVNKKMLPYNLTAGIISLDYRQEYIASMHDRSSYYYNGTSLVDEKIAIRKVFQTFARSYYQYMSGAFKSPTDIPLAPLNLTCMNPRLAQQFQPQNQNSIDVSIPQSDAIPLAFHYNGYAKLYGDLISSLLPWQPPLLAERSCALDTYLLSIIRVLVNSPPITLWNFSRQLNEPQKLLMHPVPHSITIGTLCRSRTMKIVGKVARTCAGSSENNNRAAALCCSDADDETAQNALWFLLRCLILFPSFLIPFLQCVVFIDLHLFIVATCDFVGSFLVLLRIVISAVLPHSISHEAIQREKTAAKEGGKALSPCDRCGDCSTGRWATNNDIKPSPTPGIGPDRSQSPEPYYSKTLGRFFAVSVPLGEGKARYTDDTTSVWFDSKAEYLYVSLDPEANAKDSDTVSAAAYPRIQLRDRNDKTVDREQEKYGEPLGHSHIEWEGIYKPMETFELPTWTTLPERHTLEHASVFVSIAAFRDKECAGTLHSVLSRARSRHRIYAGISEERRDADVDCLSLLELQNQKRSRELLWGEEAPRNIDLISSVVKSAKVTNLSSPSEANYTKTPCQCTGSSRTYFECSEVKKEQTPGCLEGLIKHYPKLYACSDEEYAIECIKSNSTVAAELFKHESGENVKQITDAKDQPFWCIESGGNHYCSDGSDAPGDGGESDNDCHCDENTGPKDSITCIAGNVESARDEFLLALHNRLPQSHKRYSSLKLYMDSLSTDTILLLRENFPLLTTRVTPPESARGPTYGRFITSLLYFNQDYYMVVDSHSRFSVHWDNKMILRIYQLPTSGVLSHYPNGYLPESPEGEFDKNEVMGMCKGQILANGMPKLGANWMPLRPHPTLEAFAAAGYLFGDAQFALDTPFDPFLSYLFDGEEILYSVRMWTHGWDIYCPAESNVFHFYGRPDAPKFWSLMTVSKRKIQTISEQRALYLMERAQPWIQDKHRYGKDPEYIPPNKRRLVTEAAAKATPRISIWKEYYGMGTNRTLEQFWDYAQLSDKYVVSKDNEDRWEGGQDLCRKQRE
eukprot:gene6611-4731_t